MEDRWRLGRRVALRQSQYDGKDNAGPGLGTAAYDPASEQLFVTDLEFGLIHRLGLDGSERGSFDHGTTGRSSAGLEAIPYDAARRMGIERPEFNVEDPFTWGFADARRRVFAVAVQDGRVYYSVAKPLQIWSVGLNADGSFADDARAEFDVKDTPNDNIVTNIVFDGPDTLYLSQRGGLTGSYDYSIFAKLEKPVVRRYTRKDERQALVGGGRRVRRRLQAAASIDARRSGAELRLRRRRHHRLRQMPRDAVDHG